ncbi:zinc ribbon domain-containing protein [Sporomusa malonica]|nr:zinc ribbon domain-containing protein [Sporomusa malonica]
MERRRNFAVEHSIQKLEYATTTNPFAGRVICGSYGKAFGRKVWNSTDERFRRVIWRCNGKYPAKGEKGCNSKHIYNEVLYQVVINIFNTLIENRDYFIAKWNERLKSDNALYRYKARQFMKIILETAPLTEFKIDLYKALAEKMTVVDGKQIIVTLLDGTELECVFEQEN